MTIKIEVLNSKAQWQLLPHQRWTFSGGEEHVRLQNLPEDSTGMAKVTAHVTNSQHLMELLLVIDALKNLDCEKIDLVLPYLPYARQDRVCALGEALSARLMGQLLNTMPLDSVTVWDVHSDKALTHVNRGQSLSAASLIAQFPELIELMSNDNLILVAPDKGAQGRCEEIAKRFAKAAPLIASKHRNTLSGSIESLTLTGEVKGKRVLIADDICDGGRTFIALAKLLRQMGAKEVYLYVTHGIFSQGLEVFNGLIDGVFVANCMSEKPLVATEVSFVQLAEVAA